jgi:acyl-CoA reductase-like NAD-dependent aldehyde dehydrogenase
VLLRHRTALRRAPLYDAFVEKAAAWVSSGLKLGNPLEQETTIGPMANVRFAQKSGHRPRRPMQLGGARGLIDPKLFPADDGGAYLMPQILVDVTHDMRVMRDESFGPVVGIMPVDSDEQALR